MSEILSNSIYISFLLEDGTYENLHAYRISDKIYIIDNSPFYCFDISYGDIVYIKDVNGRILFDSIKERGGHSTYRIKLPNGKSHDDFLNIFRSFEKLGCTYEGSGINNRRLYSIDIPAGVDVNLIYSFLTDAENRGELEFEEAHLFNANKSYIE